MASAICTTVSALPAASAAEYAGSQNKEGIELPDITLPGTDVQTSVIKSADAGRIKIIRGYSCYEDNYYDDGTGDYVYYTRYEYLYRSNEIVLTFNDDSQITLNSLGDGFYYNNEYYEITVADDQKENPWGVGVHTVNCSVLDFNFTVEVEIIETAVTGVDMENDIIIVENTNCFKNTLYDEATGEYVTYNVYNFRDVEPGFIIHFDNGDDYSVKRLNDTVYYDYSYYSFSVKDDQGVAPWGLGVHTVTCSLMNYEFTVDVHIVASPVTKIEVGQITLVKELDGWWEEYYDDSLEGWVDFYKYDVLNGKTEATVYFADREPVTVDGLYSCVDYNGVSYSFLYIDEQDENPWNEGDHTARFEFMGYRFDVPVKIIKSHITRIDAGRITLIEGTHRETESYYDENDNYVTYEYYRYNNSAVDITVYFDEGEPVTISRLYNLINYNNGAYAIFICDDGQRTEPWGVGVHTVKCDIMNYEFTLEVEIIPSPVTEVTVSPLKIVKNNSGDYSNYYDDEKDEWVEYFRYDYARNDVDITIYLKDADPVHLTYIYGGFEYDGNDYYITADDDGQSGAPWDVGEHRVLCSILGYDFYLPVQITESPVTGVTAEPITIVRGFNCYEDSYYDGESGEWGVYNKYDFGNIDTSITVNFDDCDPVTLGRLSESVDYNGVVYPVTFEEDQWKKPWDVGVHEVRCSLLGYDFTVKVEIIETPVTSVEAETVRIIKDTDIETASYYDDVLGRDVEYERYDIRRNDALITIHTADGGEYELSGLGDTFYYGNSWTNVVITDDDQKDEPWGVGNHTVTCSVLNYEFTVNVEILPSPVTRVETNPIKIVKGFRYNTDSYYDDASGEWVEYNRYYYDDVNSEFTLYFDNGESVSVQSLDDMFEYDGTYYSIKYRDDQRENLWDVGTHDIQCSALGFDFTAQVEIIEPPVTGVETNRITIVKGCFCREREYYDEALGITASYLHYDILTYDIMTELTVSFSDSDPLVLTCLCDEVIYNGAVYYIDWEDDQDKNHWDVGVHTMHGSILGYEFDQEIEIIENPVTGVEAGRITFIKNNGGYEDWYYDETGRVDFYHYELALPRIEITVSFADGDTAVIDGIGSRCEYKGAVYHVDYTDPQYGTPWTVGSHTVPCRFMGFDFDVEAEIVESPVVSVSSNPAVIIKNTGGYSDYYYDSEIGDYVNYYHYAFENKNINLVLTYENGETKTIYTLREDVEYNGVLYHAQYNDPQDGDPWDVGMHTVECSIMGCTFTALFNVIDTPIESITVDPITFYEGNFTSTVTYWDNDLNEYVTYSRFEIKNQCIYTVFFKDGTSQQIVAHNFEYGGVSYDYNVVDDQSRTNVWGVGEHTATLTLLGVSAPVKVTVLQSPVKSVTAQRYRMLENSHIHTDFYRDDQGNEIPYNVYDSDYRGANIVITYQDGTTENGVIYNGAQYDGKWYSIDTIDDQNFDNRWGVGVHYVRCSVIGYEFTLEVEIVECPVERVEIDDVVIIENTHIDYSAYYDDATDEWIEYPYYDYVDSCSLTVYFKDGTSAEMVNGRSVRYDGMDLFFERIDDQDENNRWGVGGHRARGRIGGYEFEFDVIIKQDNIASISVSDTTVPYARFDEYYKMKKWLLSQIGFSVTAVDGSVYTGNLYDGVIIDGTQIIPDTDRIPLWNDPGSSQVYSCSLGEKTAEFVLTVEEGLFTGIRPEPGIRIPENTEKENRKGYLNGSLTEYSAFRWEDKLTDATVFLRNNVSEHILGTPVYSETDEYTKEEYDRVWENLDFAGASFALGIVDCCRDRYVDRYAETILGMSADEIYADENLVYVFSGVFWQFLEKTGDGGYIGKYSKKTYTPEQFTTKAFWEEIKLHYTDDNGVVDYSTLSMLESGYNTLFDCVDWTAGIDRGIFAHDRTFTYNDRKYTIVPSGDNQIYEPWDVDNYNEAWVLIVDEEGAIWGDCCFGVDIVKAPSENIEAVSIESEVVYEYEATRHDTDHGIYTEYNLYPWNLRVTLTVNGSVIPVQVVGSWEEGECRIAEIDYNNERYRIYIYGWQREDKPWIAGSNMMDYEFYGITGQFEVRAVEIQSVQIDDINIIVGTSCDENGIYEYFPTMTVTYTDGSSIRSTDAEFRYRYYTEVTDTQHQTKWGVGSHTAYASLNGREKIPFTVNITESLAVSVHVEDVVVFEEKNNTFTSAVYDKKTGKYVRGTKEYDGALHASATLKDGRVLKGINCVMDENGGPVYRLSVGEIEGMLNSYVFGSGTHRVSYELMGIKSSFNFTVIESYYDTHAFVLADGNNMYTLFTVLDDDKYEKGTVVNLIGDTYRYRDVYAAVSSKLGITENEFDVAKITAEKDGKKVLPDGTVRVSFNIGLLGFQADPAALGFFSVSSDGKLTKLNAEISKDKKTVLFELNDDDFYVVALVGNGTDVIKGDVNGDGLVDNKDVVTLFRYVSGSGKLANPDAADINGDGEINNKDVVALFRAVSQ